jgi:hypothetical protein
MKSPRFGESGLHRRKSNFGWLVALAAVLIAAPCRAQSTGVAVPDSAVAPRRDSAGTDSAAVAPSDSLARPGADSATPPGSLPPPPAPVDSALGAVCEETAHGPPDVFLVTFLPSITEAERMAVAREVGGTLLGMSEHGGPGSWYLRVPGSAGDPAVADRLILLSSVLEVGSTRCSS